MSDRPLSERVRSEFEPVCDCARWIRCRWCTLADEIAELEAAGLVVAEDNTRLMAEARSLEAESDRLQAYHDLKQGCVSCSNCLDCIDREGGDE